MADRTYQELNLNEIRAVQLTIENSEGIDFAPSAAYVQVNDKRGNVVVARQSAFITNNNAYTIVGTATTSAEGNYNLIWEILKSGYTYYHCTELEIIPLCLGD